MTLLKLTHANTKQSLYIVKTLVAGFYYSEGHKCTHVVATGGAVFPALESVDDVTRLLNAPAMTAEAPTVHKEGQSV
jgi:hypothetical protein